MNPLRMYDYLLKTRPRLVRSVELLGPEEYARAMGFGLGSVGSTLAHLVISEWYYIERLEGRSVRPYAEWEIQYERPPGVEVLGPRWEEQGARIRSVISAERDWNRVIRYESFADDEGKRWAIAATAGDIVTQLVLHEVHHRAQMMAMLRLIGGTGREVEDIDYGMLMYQKTELRV